VASVRAYENLKATTIAAIERGMNWMRIPNLNNWEISVPFPAVSEMKGYKQLSLEEY
jgi:hypothetical protein